jgi:hypothetical protein
MEEESMKNTKWIYAALLGIVLVSFSTLSIGEETKRAWMVSACYKFNLAVWDKFNSEVASVKYTVTAKDGTVFVTERNATDDPNPSAVVFPDDFHDAKAPKISASVNCFYGEPYTWEVYVNDVLIDSGTIGFMRNKPRNKPQNKQK